MRRWLARSGKRHYTFARCEPDEHRDSPTPSLPQSIDSPEVFTYAKRKTVTVGVAARPFGSLRLSVRTPPFHGGESGSIPLGSAIPNRLARRASCDRSVGPEVGCRRKSLAPPRVIGIELCSPRLIVVPATMQLFFSSVSFHSWPEMAWTCRFCGVGSASGVARVPRIIIQYTNCGEFRDGSTLDVARPCR